MFVFSLMCIVAGVSSVVGSLRVPDRRVALETIGGGLLVLGLAIIGMGLPALR